MSNWLLRGLVFAALMVIVRLLQGMINVWETKAGLISILAGGLLYAIAVFVWGLATVAPTHGPTPTPTAAATWR